MWSVVTFTLGKESGGVDDIFVFIASTYCHAVAEASFANVTVAESVVAPAMGLMFNEVGARHDAKGSITTSSR